MQKTFLSALLFSIAFTSSADHASVGLSVGTASAIATEGSQYTILEFNSEWRDYKETNGLKDRNSGGNISYISPGIRILAGNNVSIGTPAIQNTNGDQVEPDYAV